MNSVNKYVFFYFQKNKNIMISIVTVMYAYIIELMIVIVYHYCRYCVQVGTQNSVMYIIHIIIAFFLNK